MTPEAMADVRTASVPIMRRAGESRRHAERRAALMALHCLMPGAVLGHNPDGSPFITGEPGLHLSITHSRALAAVAVCPRPVGIDAEQPRPQLLHTAPRWLTPAEWRRIRGRLPLLAVAWTVKEAVYKAHLTPGLPLQAIETSPDGRTATAGGTTYAIHTYWRGGHAVTTAIPIVP